MEEPQNVIQYEASIRNVISCLVYSIWIVSSPTPMFFFYYVIFLLFLLLIHILLLTARSTTFFAFNSCSVRFARQRIFVLSSSSSPSFFSLLLLVLSILLRVSLRLKFPQSFSFSVSLVLSVTWLFPSSSLSSWLCLLLLPACLVFQSLIKLCPFFFIISFNFSLRHLCNLFHLSCLLMLFTLYLAWS